MAVFEASTTSGQPEIYTFTDQYGLQYVFFGFDADADPAAGQLWKIVDSAGNVAFVGHETNKVTAITNGYNSYGKLQQVYDESGRRFTYTCSTVGSSSTQRYTQVKAETKTGGDWFDTNNPPTGLTEVARVDYAYYGDSDSNGSNGCLKTVTLVTPLTDSGVTSSLTKYYRYYTGTYNATTNPGNPYQIKAIVGFEGTRANPSYSAATDSAFKAYAEAYFTVSVRYRTPSGDKKGRPAAPCVQRIPPSYVAGTTFSRASFHPRGVSAHI